MILTAYLMIGASLAAFTLQTRRFRQQVDKMALEAGMRRRYGRQIWALGTIICWPVGLFVSVTGRPLLIGRANDINH